MTTAVGELTGHLKKMDGGVVVLCNLYFVVDLRDCIGGCCGSGDALDGMTDGEWLDGRGRQEWFFFLLIVCGVGGLHWTADLFLFLY